MEEDDDDDEPVRRTTQADRQKDMRWGGNYEMAIINLIAKRHWIKASREWADLMARASSAPAKDVATVSVNVAKAWLQEDVWYEAESVLRVLNLEDTSFCQDTEEIDHLKQHIQAERDSAEAELQAFFDTQTGTNLSSVWKTLTAASPHLSPPSIRHGEDGHILDWSNPGVGLEIEIDGNTLQWGAHDHTYNRSEWGESPIDNLTLQLSFWLERACRSHLEFYEFPTTSF